MDHNPTPKFAQQCLEICGVGKSTATNKKSGFLSELEAQFGDFYLVPEGGTNQFAIKGCEEILTREDDCFDYICCAVGTGGTYF
jgi:1-aminocyclopropane-1-carboxylate deaminase